MVPIIFRKFVARYDNRDAPVVSKWKRLEEFDPNSQEYLIFLTTLLNDQPDRKATTSLEGEAAAVVLDILARVLDRGRNLGRLSNRTLGVLRSLAFNACQVPNHYKVDRNLGFSVNPEPFASGGFSDVQGGILGGELVAVKVLRMSEETDMHNLQKHFCKEAVLWKNISHPNILPLIAVEIDSHTRKCSMITEFMVNGNVFNFIRFNSANRLRLLADAAEGLHYLHERNIIHGDIKGSNILVMNGTPLRACLCDFGFSILTSMSSFVMSTRGMNLFGGTTPYMAPELIHPSKFGLGRSRLSKEGDIYAIGMVVYEIVTGVRPFGLENFWGPQMVCAVVDGTRPVVPENAEDIGFGQGVWDLVERCWKEDRTQRPKSKDVRQRLTVAAFLSPLVPPGPMTVPPPSQHFNTNINLYNTYESTDPDRGAYEEGGSRDDEDTRSVLERSISVAKLVVGGIQASIPPAVREKFGVFDRIHLHQFINDFRARFNFEPIRIPHPHQD